VLPTPLVDTHACGLVGRALELEIASKVGWKGRLLKHASRYCSGVQPRAGHQEHSDSGVVESREPQPRAAAACYGHVSRPGSLLRSGALGLARASLLAPSSSSSRQLPKKQLLWSEE